MNHKKSRAAFTLAEVLITLAIIGVVAALTIPTLVQNYQTRAWKTASDVFKIKLEEALRVMNTQQTLAGYRNTEDFVNELSNHFKITKICKNDDLTSCFPDKVYWDDEEIDVANLKTADKFGQDDWDTDVVGVQFANGTTGLIAYNPTECSQDPYSNQVNVTKCLAILYDTSGYKNPNTNGKDLNSINVDSLGNSKCAIETGGVCFSKVFEPTPLTKAECEAQKTDLGIKECYYESDYWAGAMAECKSKGQSLPSLEQLATLANYLYNTDKVTATDDVLGLTMDESRMAELGASYNGSYFRVWSSVEYSKSGAYYRTFAQSDTYYRSYSGNTRDSSSHVGVCVGG